MEAGAHMTPRRSSRVAARAEREQDEAKDTADITEGAAEPDDVQDATLVEVETASQPEAPDGQEDEEPELDAFDEDARRAVDAFEAAAADPATFLRPSTEVSELARKAAKVHASPSYSPGLTR